jgi:Uma2 family endonuclease
VSVQVARRHFSVAEYDQMISAGVFTDDDRLELIDGEILEMSPIGERHAACVRKANHTLVHLLGSRSLVSVQCPIDAGGWSRPQPDVALLVPRADFYSGAHPGPRHVQVVIEVSDTSLDYDAQVKVPLYARAGFKEVWLIDLGSAVVVVFTQPREGRYTHERTYERGEVVVSRRFPGLSVAVDDLLP